VVGLGDVSWDEIAVLRDRIGKLPTATVAAAAQGFASLLVDTFATIALARLFLVVPCRQLPAAERALVAPELSPATPTLALLGTAGREAAWNDRTRSVGHRAIPLVDRETVHGAPMIAKLLGDLEVNLASLAGGGPIATRLMIGGRNGMFYVPEARTTRDELGRPIIDPAFASQHAIESVFGMGGAYLDGTLAIAILFCTEHVDRGLADRYSSFIGAFKIATMTAQRDGAIF